MYDILDLAPSRRVQAALEKQARLRMIVNEKADELELSIYGQIGSDQFGDGVDCAMLSRVLAKNRGAPVHVKLNSPGGDAYAGLQLFANLTAHDGQVRTTNEAMAGSAAAIISQAASPGQRAMFDTSALFVHRASGMAVGNAQVMREVADWLDVVDSQIARAFANRTGRPLNVVNDLLTGKNGADGTQFTPETALANKFVDKIISTKATNNVRSDRESVAERREKLAIDERMEQIHREGRQLAALLA